MKFISLILLFLYIYLEVSVLVIVANTIGVLFGLLALVATSILGICIVKSQGIRNLVHLQRKIQLGESPTREISKSVLLFAGGFLLLIPGFITDIFGALILIPPIQHLFITYFIPHFAIKRHRSSPAGGKRRTTKNHKQNDEIIEGQFTRKDGE